MVLFRGCARAAPMRCPPPRPFLAWPTRDLMERTHCVGVMQGDACNVAARAGSPPPRTSVERVTKGLVVQSGGNAFARHGEGCT
mmetsp:Transcript_31500/g.78498  ORF Transcript_31500/g.78498 Transcript_31500/m.78498 type:complete len:84 (-) Transcript_31500:163-414(-)